MKKLGVLIVNYNSSKDALNLLKSLKESRYNDFDILVWDNNSSDEYLERLEKYEGIKFARSDKNLGLTGAVNNAVDLMNNKYILLLNPDIEIDKNAINELLNIIESDEKIAFVGGTWYKFNERDKVGAFGGKMSFFTGLGYALKEEKNARELKYGEYCDACILIFNREIFNELGRYDNRFFAYVETEDVLFRAMKNGYKVFINPNAKVWHKCYGSSGGKKSKFAVYHMTRNRFLFMKKNVSEIRYILFLILNFLFILPIQFILFLFRRQFDLLVGFLKGVYNGFLGRY